MMNKPNEYKPYTRLSDERRENNSRNDEKKFYFFLFGELNVEQKEIYGKNLFLCVFGIFSPFFSEFLCPQWEQANDEKRKKFWREKEEQTTHSMAMHSVVIVCLFMGFYHCYENCVWNSQMGLQKFMLCIPHLLYLSIYESQQRKTNDKKKISKFSSTGKYGQCKRCLSTQ